MPFIRFKNKRIFYRLEGNGKPVFLVHGFAEDGNVWNKQFETLKQNNLLIIPDLPGSGSSQMLDGNSSIEDYAEVLKRLADKIILSNEEEKNASFCMIGHSMGGYITLAFAEKYPQLLNSLGLFHSSAFADTEEKIATRKKGIEFIQKNGSEPFLKTSVPGLFCEQTKKEKPELVSQLMEIAKTISPEALVQYYHSMINRADRTNVLKRFNKPVLFIAGKFDSAVPLRISLEQMSMASISVIHILQHSAHMGMLEEVDLSNSFLQNFLNGLP